MCRLQRKPVVAVCLAALFVMAVSGCGDGLNYRTVTGKVTVDGKSLASGQIVITPVGHDGSSAASDIVDGVFTCPVLPGEKTVAIRAYAGGFNEMGFPIGKQLLPQRYNDQSELMISVENKSGQEYTFELQSK